MSSILPTLTTEQFRKKLVGVVDPLRPTDSPGEALTLKQEATRFYSILAKLYNVPGDRTQLWAHISKAVSTSLAKLGGSPDAQQFVSLCVESVQADPAILAACEPLDQMIGLLESWDDAMRSAWLDYIRRHQVPLLVLGRARWKQLMEGKVDL